MTGEIVPGLVDPFYRSGRTTGGPAFALPVKEVTTAPPLPNLGDQRHSEMLGALKKLGATIEQTVTQKTTDALKQTREWRG